MAKKYTYTEDEPMMVSEDAIMYPQGVTIPISLPTIGNYSVEYLKKELTAFAIRLLHRNQSSQPVNHVNWRNITISDKVKAMSLGPSALSEDTRTDKELLAEAFENQRSIAQICGVSSSNVYSALSAKWEDGEYCIQYQSALSANCDCIITRNPKDFKLSTIPVMTPEEFLDKYFS